MATHLLMHPYHHLVCKAVLPASSVLIVRLVMSATHIFLHVTHHPPLSLCHSQQTLQQMKTVKMTLYVLIQYDIFETDVGILIISGFNIAATKIHLGRV
jgi:hypothetical protein